MPPWRQLLRKQQTRAAAATEGPAASPEAASVLDGLREGVEGVVDSGLPLWQAGLLFACLSSEAGVRAFHRHDVAQRLLPVRTNPLLIASPVSRAHDLRVKPPWRLRALREPCGRWSRSGALPPAGDWRGSRAHRAVYQDGLRGSARQGPCPARCFHALVRLGL